MRPTPNIGPNVPAFLRKLWKIVNDPTIDDLVSWSPDGESFLIRNPPEFCYNLLPIYYKHNNMSSFIRQLNMYGFHKLANEHGCDKDEIRFFHPFFQQDQSRLLQHIKRKIGTTKPEERKVPLDQIGKVLSDVKQLRGRQESVDSQLATMKQENAALWRELALLRQKHMKQQQIVNKLIHFLVSLVQQPSRTTIGVKRRFPLMLNDGPQTKAIKVNTTTNEGATIHEIDTEPLSNAASLGLDDILEVSIDEEDLDDGPATVEELLHQSDQIDFPTEEILTVETPESPAEPPFTLETPQIILSEDGTSILESDPMESTPLVPPPEEDAAELLLALDNEEEPKTDMTVATRGSPSDLSKLLTSASDIGLHLDNTHGELQNIKDLLFEGGYTLDANTFLDLFNPGDMALDVSQLAPPEEDWPSSSNNELFSGSELISYSPGDLLNFDSLLHEADEEAA